MWFWFILIGCIIGFFIDTDEIVSAILGGIVGFFIWICLSVIYWIGTIVVSFLSNNWLLVVFLFIGGIIGLIYGIENYDEFVYAIVGIIIGGILWIGLEFITGNLLAILFSLGFLIGIPIIFYLIILSIDTDYDSNTYKSQAKPVKNRRNTISAKFSYIDLKKIEELMGIPGIGKHKAYALFENGYKNIEDLINASKDDLLEINGIGKYHVQEIYRYLQEKNINVDPQSSHPNIRKNGKNKRSDYGIGVGVKVTTPKNKYGMDGAEKGGKTPYSTDDLAYQRIGIKYPWNGIGSDALRKSTHLRVRKK